MINVFSSWNPTRLFACLLAVWAFGVEAATTYIGWDIKASPSSSSANSYQWEIYLDGALYGGSSGYLSPGQSTGVSAAHAASSLYVRYQYWDSGAGAWSGWIDLQQHPILVYPGHLEVYEMLNAPPAPATKYLDAPITNTTSQPVEGEWYMDGVLVHSETIDPGKTSTYTFSWDPSAGEPVLVARYSVFDITGFDVELDVVDIDLDESQASEDSQNPGQVTTEIEVVRDRKLDAETLADDTSDSAPIVWGSTSTGDDVQREGFSSVVASQQEFDEQILEELKRIREEQETQGDEAREPVDADQGTIDAEIAAQRTSAEGYADAALGDFKDWTEDNALTAGTETGGAVLNENIVIAKGPFSYTLNLSGTQESWLTSAMSALKNALAWLIAITLFAKNFRILENTMHAQFQITQVRTVGQQILGTNVKVPSAIACAVAIIAILSIIPTVAVAYLDLSGIDGVNPLSAWASGSPVFAHALHYINLMFPVGTVLTAIASHLTFRLVLLGLFAFWGATIRAIVGL